LEIIDSRNDHRRFKSIPLPNVIRQGMATAADDNGLSAGVSNTANCEEPQCLAFEAASDYSLNVTSCV
jgi:hypothetical protein